MTIEDRSDLEYVLRFSSPSQCLHELKTGWTGLTDAEILAALKNIFERLDKTGHIGI